ncbi:hypothetical protein IKI14_02050 [bacterium]|nr:hypothetical protein [bacterium]
MCNNNQASAELIHFGGSYCTTTGDCSVKYHFKLQVLSFKLETSFLNNF